MSEKFETWKEFEKELNLTPEEETKINYETKLLKATIETKRNKNIKRLERRRKK